MPSDSRTGTIFTDANLFHVLGQPARKIPQPDLEAHLRIEDVLRFLDFALYVVIAQARGNHSSGSEMPMKFKWLQFQFLNKPQQLGFALTVYEISSISKSSGIADAELSIASTNKSCCPTMSSPFEIDACEVFPFAYNRCN
jgi:hypothetical protein